MSIMISGTSGFLGQAFTQKMLEKGEKVYSLARHLVPEQKNLIPLIGDILETDLGLTYIPKDIESVYHLAGIVNLSLRDKHGIIWETNVTGTRNVVEFCLQHNVPHLYYCSTAYALDRNPYEVSKTKAEEMVRICSIPKVTIFKPSIILGEPKQHFSQFVSLIIRVHHRVELIRRAVEGSLMLPVLQPVFRLRGNSKGKLNIIPVDDVAKAMAEIESEGTFWLTHDCPPSLIQLVEWVGKAILLDLRILPDFKPTPLERAFQRMASAFTPYLEGEDLRSDLKSCQPIDENFIRQIVENILLN